MFCGYCGNKLSDNDRFCGRCGRSVNQESLPVSGPQNISSTSTVSRNEIDAKDGEPSLVPEVECQAIAQLDPNPIRDESIIKWMDKLFGGQWAKSKFIHSFEKESWSVHGATLQPDEYPLVLFGTNSRFGTISLSGWCGVMFTNKAIHYKIRKTGSIFLKVVEGFSSYDDIQTINLDITDDANILYINDSAVGQFVTSHDSADDTAVAGLADLCRTVSPQRAGALNQEGVESAGANFSVEGYLNGNESVGKELPYVTYTFLSICSFLFLSQFASGSFDSDAQLISIAERMGAKIPIIGYLICGFLHCGWIHVISNMACLVSLGTSAERLFGHLKFSLVYLACIMCGGVTADMLEPQVLAIGASGGIFGLAGVLTSYGMLRLQSLNACGNLSASQKVAVSKWATSNLAFIGQNLFFTIKFARSFSISVGAHFGGLVAGLILGATLWAAFKIMNRVQLD